MSSVTTRETLQQQSGAATTTEHTGSCGERKAVSVSIRVSANDRRGTEAEFKKVRIIQEFVNGIKIAEGKF